MIWHNAQFSLPSILHFPIILWAPAGAKNRAGKADRFKGVDCVDNKHSFFCLATDEKEGHRVLSYRKTLNSTTYSVLAGPIGLESNSIASCWRRCSKAPCSECVDEAKRNVGMADGTLCNARFNGPSGISLEKNGSVAAVADRYNGAVRMIDLARGHVTTLRTLRLSSKTRVTDVHLVQNLVWVLYGDFASTGSWFLGAIDGADKLLKKIAIPSYMSHNRGLKGIAVQDCTALVCGHALGVINVCTKNDINDAAFTMITLSKHGCHAVSFVGPHRAVAMDNASPSVMSIVDIRSMQVISRTPLQAEDDSHVNGVHGMSRVRKHQVMVAATYSDTHYWCNINTGLCSAITPKRKWRRSQLARCH